MSFDFSKYVRLWPWLQFVGVELFVGLLIWQRWNPVLGTLFSFIALGGSAFAFYTYAIKKSGWKGIFEIHRLLQTVGYAAMLIGIFIGFGHSEAGDMTAYVGHGVVLAGFAYDLLYP